MDCEELDNFVRALDLTVAAFAAFSISIVLALRAIGLLSAHEAGNMVLGAIFASTISIIPLMTAHAVKADLCKN